MEEYCFQFTIDNYDWRLKDWFNNVTVDNPQIRALAEALRALVKFVPESRSQLDEWYNQANRLLERPELLQGSPHFIWHYLADADIRMKDVSYAAMQNQRIDRVLQHLNQGRMPSDEDTYLPEQD